MCSKARQQSDSQSWAATGALGLSMSCLQVITLQPLKAVSPGNSQLHGAYICTLTSVSEQVPEEITHSHSSTSKPVKQVNVTLSINNVLQRSKSWICTHVYLIPGSSAYSL